MTTHVQSSYSDGTTTYYDLTDQTGDAAQINGALFFQTKPDTSSGTGLIQSVVRVQDEGNGDGLENGYNTSFRPLSYEENTSPNFTTSLLLAEVPVVTINGTDYYEFRLDINQLLNSSRLSLDEIKLFSSAVSDGQAQGTIGGAWFTSHANLVYDMDGAGQSSVLLDAANSSGSGSSDMFFYVPVSNFGAVDPTDTYVTLYSEFGAAGVLNGSDNLVALDDAANPNLSYNGSDAADNPSAIFGTYSSNDGFEEWSVSKQTGGNISGYKFEDVNGNGQWDNGETALAGWSFDYTISYDEGKGKNIQHVVVTGTATTDANGLYTIAVPASSDKTETYTITLTEQLKSGWSNTYDGDATANGTTTFTFSSSDLTTTGTPPSPNISGHFGVTEQMNFGNFQLFDISGTKYEDVNGNGVVDTGDNGLPGWVVFIDANNDGKIAGDTNNNGILDAGETWTEKYAITDGSGNWSITGLDASYNGLPVKEFIKTGWVQTLGPAGTINATSGNDQTGIDFANFETFSISGTKYEDVNGNGVVDTGDNGLAGWVVFIDANNDGKIAGDTNNNGVLDAGETWTEKYAITDGSGNWSITGLDASYDGLPVKEFLKTGWVQTLGPTSDIVGTSGNDQTGFDFANFETFSISGTKYEDVNGNGVVDTGDNGLAGWVVFIDADNDGKIAGDTNNNGILDAGETWTEKYAITDGSGNWSIGGLDWTYDGLPVKEFVKDGWVQTLAPVSTIDATSGNDQTGLDFANFQLFDISGTKYEDVNGNGVVDTGDNGLAGWVVFIDADNDGKIAGDTNNNGVLDAGETWTEKYAITDGSGNWSITGLDASYDGLPVKEFLKSGWVQTLGPASDIVGTSGNDQTGIDFANFETFSISGTKYNDLNDNGVVDSGEPGLPGWVIFIDANNDGKIAGDTNNNGILDAGETWTEKYAITDGSGNWSIGGLDWTYDGLPVKEFIKTGWVQTLAPVSTIDATSGNDQTGLDFANFLPAPDVDITKYVDVDPTTVPPSASDPNWDDANAALGPQDVNLGTDVWFKVVVQNTGNEELTGVTIVDNNTTTGTPGTFFTLFENGALTAAALADNAVLTGDTDGDGNIDVGETWTIIYSQAFDPGNHVNTASVTDDQNVTDSDDAHYYSLINLGPCPRTPGFWQNPKNGGQFWDGVTGNEKHAGETGMPAGELLYAVDSNHDGVINNSDVKGLLIGDYNHDGLTDNGEDTLFISYADARSLINASNKQMGDGKFMLGRDMVAVWLNFLAGVSIGDASDPQSPHHYLDDAINWMQIYAGNTAGGNSETFDSFKLAGAIKPSDPIYNAVQAGFDYSASQMHNALDYFDNTGQTQPGGTIYANCDCQCFEQALSLYESSHVSLV